MGDEERKKNNNKTKNHVMKTKSFLLSLGSWVGEKKRNELDRKGCLLDQGGHFFFS